MHHNLVSTLFPMTLQMLLGQVPFLLVYLAGIVVAMANWRRYPRPSLMVCISSAILFADNIVWAFAYGYIWFLRETQGWTIAKFGFISALLNFGRIVPNIGALILLLIAVYVGRRSASAASVQATQRAQRVSLPLYVGSTVIGQFLGGPLFLIGLIFLMVSNNSYSNDSSSALSGVLMMMGMILVLLATILYLILIYKAWDCIQDGHARTTPGKAVGFMFIPFYNLYWIFQAIPGFADDYNAYLDRAKISAPPLDRGILQAQAILQVLSIIPYVGLICALALMPIYCIVAAKICTAINALPETSASPKLAYSITA